MIYCMKIYLSTEADSNVFKYTISPKYLNILVGALKISSVILNVAVSNETANLESFSLNFFKLPSNTKPI